MIQAYYILLNITDLIRMHIYLYYYRLKMSTYTPERSAILSLLLDGVVGTQDAIEIRNSRCHCFKPNNTYFTGSKAEGLDLPGSDTDLMHDMNDQLHIK